VASQPINESGQSQEVPKVPGAPSMYFKIFLLMHRTQNFQFRHLMTAEGQLLRRKSRFSVIARTGAESDIYDCLVSILGQAWLTAPALRCPVVPLTPLPRPSPCSCLNSWLRLHPKGRTLVCPSYRPLDAGSFI